MYYISSIGVAQKEIHDAKFYCYFKVGIKYKNL